MTKRQIYNNGRDVPFHRFPIQLSYCLLLTFILLSFIIPAITTNEFGSKSQATETSSCAGHETSPMNLQQGRSSNLLPVSTLLGGSDVDVGRDLVCDDEGNIYVTGDAWSTDFPTASTVFDEFQGVGDTFLCKLSPDGRTLLWSSLIGGEYQDEDSVITIDENEDVYIAGNTRSDNFPTTTGVYQPTKARYADTYVCKFRGTDGALEWATYLGGESDDKVLDVVVDSSGNVYICGRTDSDDFPTTPGAFNRTYIGSTDGFITKLSSDGSALLASTFLGGWQYDGCSGIDIDNEGFIYVTGSTTSDFIVPFPVTDDAYQQEFAGNVDAFITKLDPNLTSLAYSTYFGADEGSGEVARDIKVDEHGNAIIYGETDDYLFPTTEGAFQPVLGGNEDAFIAKISADGSSLVFSSFLGGNGYELFCEGLDIDEHGNIYVTGSTSSDDFPTTKGAYRTVREGRDAFVCRISPDGANLSYSTLLGGKGNETGYGIFTLSNGTISIAGTTNSTDFPTTSGAYQITLAGDWDAFVSLLGADFNPPVADAGDDRIVDEDVPEVFDGSASHDNVGIVSYTWSFYEGDNVTILDGSVVNYTFIQPGRYFAILTIEDPAGFTDSDRVNVTVLDVTPPNTDAGEDFLADEDTPVQFNGSGSHDNVGVVNWTWSFEYEGKNWILYGPRPSFVFQRPGVYSILLVATDAAGNNGSAYVNVTIRDVTAPIAVAGMDIEVGQHAIVYFNASQSWDNVGIVEYNWTIQKNGELDIRSGIQASFEFIEPGEYTVTLNVSDGAGNSAIDQLIVRVRDSTSPVAVVGDDVEVEQHQLVVLNGSRSSDNVGVVEWHWSFDYNGATQSLNGSKVDFMFDDAGVYTVTLRIADAVGNWAEDELIVTVRDTTPPDADAGADVEVDQYETLIFDASSSGDNVAVINWSWSFTHNGTAVRLFGLRSSFIFEVPGNYTVTLTLEDGEGNQGMDELVVKVRDVTPPIASAGDDTSTRQGGSVTLDGRGSTDNVGIVNWSWAIVGKDGTVELFGPVVEHVFGKAGNYTVTLKVRDFAGNVGTDVLYVEVTPKKREEEMDWSLLAIIIALLSILAISMILLTRKRRSKV